jgi:hypothetical protein
MSSAVGAHPPGGLHQEPEPTSAKDQAKARALGLTSATGLVVGTVVGAGVFTMPAVLASAGTLSLVVLAVIAVGAMVLATLFGQLTKRVPNSDGGLYALRPARVRQREHLHIRAMYEYHPMFAGGGFATWYGGDDASHLPASVEGGDVHVLGHGAVLIGMGERTTPMAAEILARALFAGGQARTAITIELPRSHAMMHLDTVMTMIDRTTFVRYPYIDRHPRS